MEMTMLLNLVEKREEVFRRDLMAHMGERSQTFMSYFHMDRARLEGIANAAVKRDSPRWGRNGTVRWKGFDQLIAREGGWGACG